MSRTFQTFLSLIVLQNLKRKLHIFSLSMSDCWHLIAQEVSSWNIGELVCICLDQCGTLESRPVLQQVCWIIVERDCDIYLHSSTIRYLRVQPRLSLCWVWLGAVLFQCHAFNEETLWRVYNLEFYNQVTGVPVSHKTTHVRPYGPSAYWGPPCSQSAQ